MNELKIVTENNISLTLIVTPLTEITVSKTIEYTYKDFIGAIPADSFDLNLLTLSEDIKIIQKAILTDIITQYQSELASVEITLGLL